MYKLGLLNPKVLTATHSLYKRQRILRISGFQEFQLLCIAFFKFT